MRALAAHIDGLFVERASEIPNTDPLAPAVNLWLKLAQAIPGSTLLTTCTEDSGTLRSWLKMNGLEPSWIATVPVHKDERIQATLSAAGGHGVKIDYYVTNDLYCAGLMASTGAHAVHLISSTTVMSDPRQVGATWDSYGIMVDDNGDGP